MNLTLALSKREGAFQKRESFSKLPISELKL
jgi:hypothetical protein